MPSVSKPDGQPAEPESRAPGPLPPAEVPPPGTDAGCVVLLDVLRRRVEGFPTWMLPRYVVHDADVYSYHPEELLQGHPSATSPDGKRAWYFLNLVRPKSASDQRRKRAVPGGTWKSEQAPVPVEAAPGKMVGSKQSFSFVSKEQEDEDGVRGGFIMYEFVLPAQAGRLAGGDELVLSKIFLTPRVDKKRKRVDPPSARLLCSSARPGSARRSGASSSPPPLRQAPAASSASTLLQPPGSARRSGAAPSPPPLRQAPAASSASTLAPQGPAASSASSRVLQGPATSPRPPSSARPLRQGPGTSAPPSLRQGQGQGPAKRVLVLEVGDSPPREGKSFSCQPVYKAMELLRSGSRVSYWRAGGARGRRQLQSFEQTLSPQATTNSVAV